MSSASTNLHIVIIGAGLGGLTAAIACRRTNPPLDVTVVERSPEILSIGAGIHIPPNACRILTDFGLLGKLKKAGGYEVENFTLRRYADGQVLAAKPLKEIVQREHGAEWIAIHRGDYQSVLLEEAMCLGANVMVHAEAVNVEVMRDAQTTVFLNDNRQLHADVVIGADGLWSRTREIVVGHPILPQETGDLAYRATFSRDDLLALNDTAVNTLLNQSSIHVWLGPGKHAVFYPLRKHTEYNLVLLVADDLPTGTRTASGSIEEMTNNFDGWDDTLRKIMSCSSTTPLKWKLLHLEELKRWTQATIALIGDASHPSLPYLGQGAAMAVEDGATLGLLLAECNKEAIDFASQREKNEHLTKVLCRYEKLRKDRAEHLVAGAIHTRHYYHLLDGIAQQMRDEELAQLSKSNWSGECSFNWGDAKYQKDLLSFSISI